MHELLEKIGLTSEQAKIYLCLVSKNTTHARKISLETGINRSLVYRIVKQLIDLGLVIENTAGSVTTFTALHPSKLHAIVKEKEQELKRADNALHEVVASLGSQFNLVCNKPNVRFYEGLDGINLLNKDILSTKSDIKLIRSPFDNNTDELEMKAKKLLEDRVSRNIHTKLIVPIKNTPSSITPEWDQKNLIERKRVPRDELLNPAQMLLYKDKVAFTSFNDCMITTIIEDKNIAATCEMFFDALWEKYTNNTI